MHVVIRYNSEEEGVLIEALEVANIRILLQCALYHLQSVVSNKNESLCL